MELTKNAIVVTYVVSGFIAFVINYPYGEITFENLREYCIAYFSRFHNEIIKVEFEGQGNCTKIHVHTDKNVIILNWNWHDVF